MYTDWSQNRGTVSAIVLGLATIAYLLYRRITRAHISIPPGAVAVGKVKRLFLYPVKSVPALTDYDEVYVASMGLTTVDKDNVRDRSWMVVSATNVFVSQRAEPKMALIKPSVPFAGDMLHLDAPGMPTLKISKYLSRRTSPVRTVSVWGMRLEAVDCGDEAAKWMSTYLGKEGFRVVFLSPDLQGRRLNDGPSPQHKMFRPNDKVAFPDLAPVMMMSENTVNDVNTRVKDHDITEKSFRPNILVEGCDAYDEDTWDEVFVGQVNLKHIVKCGRCVFTTVDPKTGTLNQDKEPLKTLKSYRQGKDGDPNLGIYLSVIQEGIVKTGDTVYVTKKQ